MDHGTVLLEQTPSLEQSLINFFSFSVEPKTIDSCVISRYCRKTWHRLSFSKNKI